VVQFYVDGYRTGDPFLEEPHPSVRDRPDGLPETTDVLVVGCGPAGLVLAAQMASFPDLRTVVVDRRDGPHPTTRTSVVPGRPSGRSRTEGCGSSRNGSPVR